MHLSLDEIDKVIISQVSKNARVSSQQIRMILDDLGLNVTDRTVRQRLHRLEKRNIILGYSALLNPSMISEKVHRMILIKFKYSANLQTLIERLTTYVKESPFCIYSARLSGDFDFMCNFVFDSPEQYELESDNFLGRFSELISEYRTYDTKVVKATHYTFFDEQDVAQRKRQVYEILNSVKKYDNINDRLQAMLQSVVSHFGAKFARIWFVDEDRKMLILKFSVGIYTNTNGEFAKIPVNTAKIGQIVMNNKPQVSNDVSNDPRVKHPEWAKREGLNSFAGYPLMHNGKAVGVLAMFSMKRFSPIDFEILEIFCNQLSKELSGFFELKDFLS